MANMTLDELPAHILVKIFSYLKDEIPCYYRGSDLIRLTEVCSKFNDLISSMGKFKIRFNEPEEKDFSALLMSNRNYDELSIRFLKNVEPYVYALKALLNVCQRKGSPIKSVEQIDSGFNLNEAIRMFSSINGYFEKLELYKTDLPKLIQFKFCTCQDTSQLPPLADFPENLLVSKNTSNSNMSTDQDLVTEFLKRMTKLKDLTLSGLVLKELFEDNSFATENNLNLEAFCADGCDSFDNDIKNNIGNLHLFLTGQTSLKILELQHLEFTAEFAEAVLSLQGLENFTLYNCEINIARPLAMKSSSITQLEMNGCPIDLVGLTELFTGCPNITNLHLETLNVETNVTSAIVILKLLKELTLKSHYNLHIDPVKIPTLEMYGNDGENFGSSSENYADLIIKFLKINPQLKKVEIPEEIKITMELTEVAEI